MGTCGTLASSATIPDNGGMAKKKKFRADFRKNRAPRSRQADLTREYRSGEDTAGDAAREERISGKGELTRKRVVVGEETDDGGGFAVLPEIDLSVCRRGRVLCVF